MHSSIRLETPCEFINVVPINPLISKCQIKVCYVGDEPNRNRSIITKDVAREMANSLPGSPIVGYYNEDTGDFEEHNRELVLEGDNFSFKDATRPYGFVDLNAKCWFQKFLDDGQVEHEYLMTEGYLWTGQYPEASRIIEKGNNQSMELDDKLIDATWAKDNNGKTTFFIINEAIISKLCILGEDFEPCFEGSNITKVEFSLGDEFKTQLFSMIEQMQKILNEGGKPSMDFENRDLENEQSQAQENPVDDTEFKKKPEDEPAKEEKKDSEEDKAGKSDNEDSENKSEDEKSDSQSEESEDDKDSDNEDDEDEKKKKKYNLEDIPEYTELASKYSTLETQYNDLMTEKANLESQINDLKNFKLNTERVQKQDMINNTFYMLSDEDKKDVIENIDNYSLDEIEAKLSILCVRNKVSFAALDDSAEGHEHMTFNVDNTDADDSVPAWIKAVLDTAKTL